MYIIGDRYMTACVHGLLHLPDDVHNLGPLWNISCFAFESANGELMKLFHGSQGVEKQVSHIQCTCTSQLICPNMPYTLMSIIVINMPI